LEIGTLTWTCTTNFRLRKPACRTNYTLRAIGIQPRLASVIGLAPIRPGLKDRLLELLCIHGRLTKLVPEVGIAPTSPRLQRGANLSQLLGGAGARQRLVVPAGNAPASSGYQPGALLLSYETMAEGVGNVPTSALCRSCFRDKCSQLISACPPLDLRLPICDLRFEESP
jgi:hypothetical protein